MQNKRPNENSSKIFHPSINHRSIDNTTYMVVVLLLQKNQLSKYISQKFYITNYIIAK